MQATLSHYRILEQIGAGGMGVVYRAHDERLDRDVALKVLPADALADEAARKRFHKEALALSKLNHPNVATVFDFDSDSGSDFLVEELIPGLSLSEMLISGPLPEREIINLGSQLCEGLAAAHEQGVIHRDLKPGNIRVTPDARLKILDFGLAKLMPGRDARQGVSEQPTASLTETQTVSGTLPYMAPEQLLNETLDARTDIWAVGCVLYEMATGRRPFPGSGPALADAILHQQPATPSTLNARVSPGLEAIILKCLEKDPTLRYASARDMCVDLHRLSVGRPAIPVALRRQRLSFTQLGALAAVLLLVVGGAIAVWLRHKPAAAPVAQIRSLAVLPLSNLSGDPQQEYFADGMTEALITDLSKIRALKVISRTSVMQYKGVKKPLREIAGELGVDGVIEGSVLKSGDRVRITAQLIEAREDRHLWADSYNRDLRDVLTLQSEVASAIAGQVRAELTPQQETRLAEARPVNPEAYKAYLEGRYLFGRISEENVGKAIRYYEQAVKLDPGYALAWASLAEARNFQAGSYGPLLDTEKARQAAERALALDSNVARAHAVMGDIKRFYDWDWMGAEASYQRELALEPGDCATLWSAAELAATLGRFEQALALNRRAVEVNPLDAAAYHRLGLTAWWAGRLDEATAAVNKALELNPQYPWLHMNLGIIYLRKSRPQEALAEMQKETHPVFRVQGQALAYFALGRKKESDAALAELIAKWQTDAAYQVALVYAYRGETDQAFRWLEKAYSQRDGGLIYVKGDPLLKNLERDPRYAAFLKKMRLPLN